MKCIKPLGLFLCMLMVGLSACDDTKTYAEQLADEKESIQVFMENRGYTVSRDEPETVPYPEGVFYLTESGLYIHVLDTGALVETPLETNREFTVRFYEVSMDGDTIYQDMAGSSQPYKLYYNTVQSARSHGDCLAWHEPLSYVGDGGHVYIIAPTKLGMSMYTSSSTVLTPRFYELRYTFVP
ncbi:MAG: DUF4827 family protein [Bacteroidales bacterium]|jgi:hypothetical protein|nr:DUF4827 family protein [Bacteroidales bacterium]HKL92893.1 DUF4827 family protein [Bacteroidales bacterium]